MREIFLIFTILTTFASVLSAASSTIETLNQQSVQVFKQLDKNYQKALKESLATNKKPGVISRLTSFIWNWKSSFPAPQADLDELAQIYVVLNSADIAALYYLNKNCQQLPQGIFDPVKDPVLCLDYPEILVKQVQSRLGVINSCLVHSLSNILKTPPRWLYHVMTVAELMRNVDPKGLLEYRVQQAVIGAVSPQQFKEFESTPNILNQGKLGPTDSTQVQAEKQPVSSSSEPSNSLTALKEPEIVQSLSTTQPPQEKESNPSNLSSSPLTLTPSTSDQSTPTSTSTTTPQQGLLNSSESQKQDFAKDPRVSISRQPSSDTISGGHLEVHVQI